MLLTGHQVESDVKIMHTSTPNSTFRDGTSLPSTVRSCGSGVETTVPPQQQHPLQSSANPVLAETFDRHWQQLRGIAAHNVRFNFYS